MEMVEPQAVTSEVEHRVTALATPTLAELAKDCEAKGWQLVPCRWSARDEANNPLVGLTGAHSWRNADEVLSEAGQLATLTTDPHARGRNDLLPAVRTPAAVIGIDVDHGYGGKRGLDTISAMEALYGPLPATHSMTARGPDSPSRRLFYRVPPSAVITDAFFARHGGDVEVIRMTHRFSWCPPGIHHRNDEPVVCYAPDGAVCELAHVADLAELPAAWAEGAAAFMRSGPATGRAFVVEDGEPEDMTMTHAAHIVAQATDRLAPLMPKGGEFRNKAFGLARTCALFVRMNGGSTEHAVAYALEQFGEAHPGLVPDAHDLQWIHEGVAKAWSIPGWRRVTEPDEVDHGPEPAITTDDEDDEMALCAVTAGGAAPPVETARTSWTPLDLGPYLRGEVERPTPSIGASRADGLQFLYPGKEHTVIGEMESGKSWFSLQCAAVEIRHGHHVVYIHFEEDDPSDSLERLDLLGLDEAEIAERFHFVAPDAPVSAATMAALVALLPTLVVLDGVNEAMSLHEQKIREEDGAAAFRRRLVKPFTAAGAAVLGCDHVVKDADRRGGTPLGSVHKGNGLSGALLLLEGREPFGRGMRGRSSLYVTKDRPGHLRHHGQPTAKSARTFYMGEMVIDPRETNLISGDEHVFTLRLPCPNDDSGPIEAPTHEWNDPIAWPLPADVRAITGRGAAAVPHLALYMRMHAADPRGTGVSRIEAIRVVRKIVRPDGRPVYKDESVIRHAWDRLVAAGRLGALTKSLTSASQWVPKPGDPKPGDLVPRAPDVANK